MPHSSNQLHIFKVVFPTLSRMSFFELLMLFWSTYIKSHTSNLCIRSSMISALIKMRDKKQQNKAQHKITELFSNKLSLFKLALVSRNHALKLFMAVLIIKIFHITDHIKRKTQTPSIPPSCILHQGLHLYIYTQAQHEPCCFFFSFF